MYWAVSMQCWSLWSVSCLASTSCGAGRTLAPGQCRQGSTAALRCTVLYYTVLYCTVLYCTVLYCTILYRDSGGDVGARLVQAAGVADVVEGWLVAVVLHVVPPSQAGAVRRQVRLRLGHGAAARHVIRGDTCLGVTRGQGWHVLRGALCKYRRILERGIYWRRWFQENVICMAAARHVIRRGVLRKYVVKHKSAKLLMMYGVGKLEAALNISHLLLSTSSQRIS